MANIGFMVFRRPDAVGTDEKPLLFLVFIFGRARGHFLPLLRQPILEPAPELIQSRWRNIKNLQVRWELHLVSFANQ